MLKSISTLNRIAEDFKRLVDNGSELPKDELSKFLELIAVYGQVDVVRSIQRSVVKVTFDSHFSFEDDFFSRRRKKNSVEKDMLTFDEDFESLKKRAAARKNLEVKAAERLDNLL